MTSCLLVSSKSISKSGIDTLAGLRNLSKMRSKGIGSILVISINHASTDQAQDHLPGPTPILLSFARFT
jgi:hypothetical protein